MFCTGTSSRYRPTDVAEDEIPTATCLASVPVRQLNKACITSGMKYQCKHCVAPSSSYSSCIIGRNEKITAEKVAQLDQLESSKIIKSDIYRREASWVNTLKLFCG